MHAHDLDTITPLHEPAPVGPAPGSDAREDARELRAEQGVATVLRALGEDEGGGWWLRLDTRELRAERAASCMLAPEQGDQVWVAGDGEHGIFVLAVLVRANSGPTTLSVEGDLEIAASGALRLHAESGVDLDTPGRLALNSDNLEVQAREGHLSFVSLRAVAREVFASLTRVTRVGKLLELLVDTVTQRSNNSYRAIAGVEHVQAKLINQEASADLHLSASRALINGEDIVKMDGGQIHLG